MAPIETLTYAGVLRYAEWVKVTRPDIGFDLALDIGIFHIAVERPSLHPKATIRFVDEEIKHLAGVEFKNFEDFHKFIRKEVLDKLLQRAVKMGYDDVRREILDEEVHFDIMVGPTEEFSMIEHEDVTLDIVPVRKREGHTCEIYMRTKFTNRISRAVFSEVLVHVEYQNTGDYYIVSSYTAHWDYLQIIDEIAAKCTDLFDRITPRAKYLLGRFKPLEAFDKRLKYKYKLPLRNYQIDSVAISKGQSGLLLADSPGLGKTLQSVAMVHERQAYPCLVICPLSLTGMWESAFYEYVVGSFGIVKVFAYSQLKSVPALAYKSVIVDESHMIKNPGTLRFKQVLKLTSGIPFKLLLSGTPVINRITELAPQLRVIKFLSSQNFSIFRNQYRETLPHEMLSARYKRLIKDLSSVCMIRRTKDEVAKELPSKTRLVIKSEITTMKEYKLAETDFKKYLMQIKRMPKEEVDRKIRGEILVRLSALREIIGRGLIDSAEEIAINTLAQGESILLFTHHRDIAHELQQRFETKYLITGDTSAHFRTKLVKEFQESRDAQVFIATIRSGGVGLTLTKANNVLHVEKDWTAAAHDQATDRTHRIGQQKPVLEMFFSVLETIDERMMELLDHKRNISSLGSMEYVKTEKSMINEVLETYFKFSYNDIGGTEDEIAEASQHEKPRRLVSQPAGDNYATGGNET